MIDKTLRFALLALASAALVASLTGCPQGLHYETDSTNGATPHASNADGGDAGTGIPCDVAYVLKQCTSCHTAHPTAAPMPLLTYEDFIAPAKSDPTKRVADLVVTRVQSTTNPMPPSAPLAAGDIATLVSWIGAGPMEGSCEPTEAGTSDDAGLPECVFSSDCPGVLICRDGKCDVECVTDKDCVSPSTCEDTVCVAPAPDAGPSPVFNDLTSRSAWATYQLPINTSATYNGTVFDGRYAYFAPDGPSGLVLRYDSTIAFSSARAWSTFDLATINANANTFRGAVFDGRYVYLVPNATGALFARFDTQGAFMDAGAWTLFDLKTVNGNVGFTGATFDGRYIYLAPTWSSGGIAFRYDTQGPLTTLSSWSTFSMTTLSASAHLFEGAVFDGNYVYFVPNGVSIGPYGVLARYDVSGAFTDSTSWSTLDLTTLNTKATGYRTGIFDGRYLYLVPGWRSLSPKWVSSTIARYDTTAAFSAQTSWQFFDTSGFDANAAGFNAAAFDGRRIIFAPGYNGNYDGVTASFDTRGNMTDTLSWSSFDTTALSTYAANMTGASFDGANVYFAPQSGVAVRFNARSAMAGATPTNGGSTF